MDPADFGPYVERLIRSYADEHIRTGRWTREEGVGEARKEVERLLPSGLGTPNQFFFSIVADPPGQKVGTVWLAVEPRGGYVYDLLVFDPFRRHGFAEAAMRLLEGICREKGATKLSLHVFGDNAGARKLYQKLGFVETNVMMSKPLPP
jgi:ribosomal protein S18 acetylase RimI-like enzyme